MIGVILLFGLFIFAIMVLLGKAKMDNFLKFIAFLIFGPILLFIGVEHMTWLWDQTPLLPQIIILLASPFIMLGLLHLILPNASWSKQLQDSIYKSVVAVYTFPFRMLGRGFVYLVNQIRIHIP